MVVCMRVSVTTHHLELLSAADLRPARRPDADFELRQARIPCPELNRFLYVAVGAGWCWVDRLGWTRERWLAYLDRPSLETWVGHVSGTPAGYFELEAQAGGSEVEIAYFGLLPQFTGKGLGGHLLTEAARRGFAMGASRVWVHTCSLDHPQALANYEARGFRVFKVETEEKDVPEEPAGSWPGAAR
jgi:ribosomal protein S18 acetylase RimI-like enzyme